MSIEDGFRAQLGPEFDHSAKPTVYFFDHAVAIESDDRPRFKNAVYISKTSKTSLDTQNFQRKMLNDDKAEFPDEWAHYLKVKENLKVPRCALLPGIDMATLFEMKAVSIYNLAQLIEQDLFPEWAELARSILNARSEHKDKGRVSVQGDANIQPARVLGIVGAGGGKESHEKESLKEESYTQKGYAEKSIPQENITFSMEM